MEPFDDRPLDRTTLAAEPPPQESRRASLTPVVLVTVAGLALGAAAAWWWASGDRAETPAPATAPATGTDTTLPAAEESAPLPPLDEMDTFLRTLLATLSSHPDLARWLATDDLTRQMARGIDRVSRGQTPAADLAVFRPTTDFRTTGGRSNITIDPASYRRYDNLAALVDSLDARAVADVYRTIYPRLDEAYRSLGRADSGVNQAVDVALQRLIDTPVPDGPLRLVPGRGSTYAYAEPEFEQLAPVQKQLLRMGPQNVERVQAKLREIKAAIDAAPPR